MLEDYLLGNRIIRAYCNLFSDKEVNKVIRYTLILGIQTLKEELPNFNNISPQEIESIIIENLKGEKAL
jgi:hypothetical protein